MPYNVLTIASFCSVVNTFSIATRRRSWTQSVGYLLQNDHVLLHLLGIVFVDLNKLGTCLLSLALALSQLFDQYRTQEELQWKQLIVSYCRNGNPNRFK